ncbi:xylulose kinase [Nitratireductor sp. CAU 1489]|uniref:Xylulose kinase n=1 Tax=Nitratireductor arenosus TaxID=2682096 RepID=A0A844QHJ1_9HYPH|nr:xylulose kinase [Nitratireductor arenosus]
MERGLLAVDAGSSALKAVLFDASGMVVEAASHPLRTISDATGRSEQDAEDWWRALGAAVSALDQRQRITALVLTGSMQNLIVAAPDGRPLAPAILYSDRRLASFETAAVYKKLPPDYALRCGNHPDPAHTIVKLIARDRHLPTGTLAGDVRLLFGAKDALALRLTGRAAIDPTTASTTGLMDIHSRRWDTALLDCADLAPRMLPDILPADAVVGTLLPAPAAELGLAPGLPVYNGAGDAAAATWGALADRPGTAYAYIGTTGWVAATLPLADAAPPRDIYTLADPVHADRAIVISPFLTAGAALDWVCDIAGADHDTLLERATEEDASPPEALFLPYLSGERGPFEDGAVRGGFLGLDRSQRSSALAYAAMEGIAFAIRHNLDTAGLPPSPLTIIGGGARHALQRQLLADSLARPVMVPSGSREMTAFGLLRMVAGPLGLALADHRRLAPAETVPPRPERAERGERRYRTYLGLSRFARDIAPALRPAGRFDQEHDHRRTG